MTGQLACMHMVPYVGRGVTNSCVHLACITVHSTIQSVLMSCVEVYYRKCSGVAIYVRLGVA